MPPFLGEGSRLGEGRNRSYYANVKFPKWEMQDGMRTRGEATVVSISHLVL